jgi:hypothetical protein
MALRRISEILIDADADHHGAALTRHHDAFRIRLAYHRQGIGTLQFGDRLLDGLEQIGGRGHMKMDAMGDDFGVGLRREHIAQAFEVRPQGLVILDDAVVHDRDAIAGNVRMGIVGGRYPVGRPARVSNADMAGDRGGVECFLQNLHLADGTQARHMTPLDHGDACGIVAAVLQAAQPLHEDGDRVALRDHTHDSTHIGLLRPV